MPSPLTSMWRIAREEGWAALADRVAWKARLGLLRARASSSRRLGLPRLAPRLHERSQSVTLDPLVSAMPGMITRHERKYLSWYGEEMSTGAGAMVDLGAWMGASSASLASGLRRNRRLRPDAGVIHAYDLFLWDPGMAERLPGVTLATRYETGDSFLPEFERAIAPWRDLVSVHPGDLMVLDWTGGPIELLFVDAMKSWDVANRILEQFFPSLIPGVSLVVQQDFAHFYTSWIPLLMYRLREFLPAVYHVPFSCSVVFRCARAIPRSLLGPFRLRDFDEDEIAAAYAYAATLVPRYSRPALLAARAMLYVHGGELERAASELRELERAGVPTTWDVRQVREFLERARAQPPAASVDTPGEGR